MLVNVSFTGKKEFHNINVHEGELLIMKKKGSVQMSFNFSFSHIKHRSLSKVEYPTSDFTSSQANLTLTSLMEDENRLSSVKDT